MTAPHYPNISPQIIPALRSVILQQSVNPQYLTDPSCPYPEDLKEILQTLIKGYAEPSVDFDAPIIPDESNNIFEGAEKWSVLEHQYQLIFSAMMSLKASIQKDNRTDRAVGYFKTVTTILEKLISVGERIHSAKSVYDFKVSVLNVIENTLKDDERQQVIAQLRQETL